MSGKYRVRGMPRFSPLEYLYVGYGRWKLTKSFMYFGDAWTVIVPEGFTTDLDSVPRVPFLHAALKGRSVRAATAHDYLYKTQQGKRYADDTFLAAMKDEGLSRMRRYPIYWGVVMFGHYSYTKYSEYKA